MVNIGPSLFIYNGYAKRSMNDTTTKAPAVTGSILAPSFGGTYEQAGDDQLPPIPSGASPVLPSNAGWSAHFVTNYSEAYTQTALVSAAISVQYVGKMEDEAGLLVGGHIIGVNPEALTNDDLENS